MSDPKDRDAPTPVPETSDPIADLRRAVEMVRQDCGGKRPNMIVLGDHVAPAMVAGLRHNKARAERALRRHLSGRYDKRRRQKINGVAARLHLKHQLARIILSGIDEHIAEWERLIPVEAPK